MQRRDRHRTGQNHRLVNPLEIHRDNQTLGIDQRSSTHLFFPQGLDLSKKHAHEDQVLEITAEGHTVGAQ